jgi:hypothetical protein
VATRAALMVGGRCNPLAVDTNDAPVAEANKRTARIIFSCILSARCYLIAPMTWFHATALALALGMSGIDELAAALTPEQVRALPPAASRAVNFTRDIKPILEASCI